MELIEKLKMLLVIIIIIAVSCFISTTLHKKYQEDIGYWASGNGLTIVRNETKTWDTGPFYYVDKCGEVHKLLVEDHLGHQHTVWVRVGNIGGDDVEAVWNYKE